MRLEKSKNPKMNLINRIFFGFKFMLLFFNNNICQIISIYFKKNFYFLEKILN
jgi:hypothetical protein